MSVILLVLCWALLLWLALALSYRWIHALAWLLRGRHEQPVSPPAPSTRFAVLIPAHDEELLLGAALESVAQCRYPSGLVRSFVVADNCRDRTAQIARAAGAEVYERTAPDDAGKGQALAFGLERLPWTEIDAVAFIDADNVIDPEFLSVMDAELARGWRILQGYDGLSNPGESNLTRMMAVTSVMKNLLFYGGRRALGLSCLLMGTGMTIRSEVLQTRGWQAASIGEDLEQSLSLLGAGERIRFVPAARAYAQEAVSLRQGYVQRQRWATGRRALRKRALAALRDGLRLRSTDLFNAGLELVLPTYSATLNQLAGGGLLSLLVLSISPAPLLFAVALGLAAGLEIAVALMLMRASRETVASFVLAPVFLVWKAVIDLLAMVGFRGSRWTRTERHQER